MHATLLVMVGMTLGVDVGWQSLEDGGVEYIIQLEPQALDLLRNGEELRSDIPPFLRDQIRSYRIKVGTEEVPRDMQFAPAAKSAPVENRNTPAPDRATDDQASPESDRPLGGGETDQRPDPSTVAGERSDNAVFPQAALPSGRPPRNEPRYPAETPLDRRTMPAPGDTDPVAEQPPRIIQPDPSTTALVNHESGYHEGAEEHGAAGPSAKKSAPPARPSAAESGRWWPLTGALLTLFVSMGGNAYLGLQWWSARQRCQDLLRQLRAPRPGMGSTKIRSEAAEENGESDEDQDVRIVKESRRR